MKNKTTPIKKKQDVQKSNDNRIDEDFKGFPHAPSHEKMITPKTHTEKLQAQLKENKKANFQKKEKTLLKPRDENESGEMGSTGKNHATKDFPGNDKKEKANDEIISDGSANAFERTENMLDDDYENGLREK